MAISRGSWETVKASALSSSAWDFMNFALLKELAQQYGYYSYSLQAYHHVIKKPKYGRATMSARDARSLLEKLKSLPPQRQAEVEDFVDFLPAAMRIGTSRRPPPKPQNPHLLQSGTTTTMPSMPPITSAMSPTTAKRCRLARLSKEANTWNT
jgi:hypothetical protein